jgi:hypothetical protein
MHMHDVDVEIVNVNVKTLALNNCIIMPNPPQTQTTKSQKDKETIKNTYTFFEKI